MELPPEKKYSITTFGADGHRSRLGRYQLRVADPMVTAVNRQGGTVSEIVVVSSERNGGTWTLHAEDGAYWTAGGCNCGS